MNFINNKTNKVLFLINILILFIPILEFLSKNSNELDNYILINLIKVQAVILAIFIFLNLFFIIKKKTNFLIFYLAVCYYLSFKFYLIESIFHPYFNYKGEISILILLIFYFFLYKFLKQQLLFFKFTKIFFSIYFIIILFLNFLNFQNVNTLDAPKDLKMYVNKTDLNKKNNIYFIIIENMADLNLMEKKFKLDSRKFISNIITLNSNYIKNVYSNYDKSHLSITSLMNLELIMDENSESYKNKKKFFPHFLDKAKFSPNKNPMLFRILNKLDYNVSWIGNSWVGCEYFNEKSCIYESEKKFMNLITDLKIDENIIKIFFSYTPFIKIHNKLLSKSDTYQKYKKDDAINKFINYSNNINFDKKNFFFIHHHVNKYPFIRNQNCKLKKNNFEYSNKNYLEEYKCSLSNIVKLLNFIKNKDPNAYVLILGDQGLSNLKGNEISKIFALEKTSNCIKKKKIYDSLSLFNNFLNCSLNLNLDTAKKKIFVETENRKVREILTK